MNLYVYAEFWQLLFLQKIENPNDVVSDSEEARNKRDRRENLVVWGLAIPNDDQEEMKRQMEDFFSKHLGVNATVRSVTRTGSRSYIVKMDSLESKVQILENKNLLIGKGICVFVDADLTKRELMIQNILTRKAEEERAKGNFVRVGHMRLFINHVRWIWDDKQRKLVEAVGKVKRKDRRK